MPGNADVLPAIAWIMPGAFQAPEQGKQRGQGTRPSPQRRRPQRRDRLDRARHCRGDAGTAAVGLLAMEPRGLVLSFALCMARAKRPAVLRSQTLSGTS